VRSVDLRIRQFLRWNQGIDRLYSRLKERAKDIFRIGGVQIWNPTTLYFNGNSIQGNDIQGPREFGPRYRDDIVGFEADTWRYNLFLGRRVASVHFLSEQVAMGEETTKTCLLTIEQCHYLRQIWTSLSYVLIFAGYAL
jgi:hypothetical protein